MRFELSIASRYLMTTRRRKFISRISIISIAVVMLSVVIPIIIMSVMNGFHKAIKQSHVTTDFHIQLLNDDNITDTANVLALIKDIDGIRSMTPFIRFFGIAKSKEAIKGIIIQALPSDFMAEDQVFSPRYRLVTNENQSGIHLESAKDEVMIGKPLAEELGIDTTKDYSKRHEYINFLYTKANKNQGNFTTGTNTGEENTSTRLRVKGIYSSGYMDIDRRVVFMTLETAQKLLDYVDIVKGVGINVDKEFQEKPELLETQIVEKLPKFQQFYTNNWKQLHRNLYQAFDWEKRLISIILFIMILASLLTIYLTLNVVVMEKKRELGILMSFGTPSSRIINIFIIEGFVIGIIGTFIGCLLGVYLTLHLTEISKILETSLNFVLSLLNQTPIKYVLFSEEGFKPIALTESSILNEKALPYDFYFVDFLGVTMGAIHASLCASFFPALRASKQKPLEVIHGN